MDIDSKILYVEPELELTFTELNTILDKFQGRRDEVLINKLIQMRDKIVAIEKAKRKFSELSREEQIEYIKRLRALTNHHFDEVVN